MLVVSANENNRFIIIEPSDEVTNSDISNVSEALLPWLESGISRLLVDADIFEDWDNFASVIDPLINVDGSEQMTEIAIVSSKPTGSFGSVCRTKFSQAKVNIYCQSERDQALTWLVSEEDKVI